MCPICALYGLGGLGLLLGPLASFPLARTILRRLHIALPLTFSATMVNDTQGGWQSLPPIA